MIFVLGLLAYTPKIRTIALIPGKMAGLAFNNIYNVIIYIGYCTFIGH